ncbi:Gfo/Idh/MocA family oxidoreductase [Luteimonas sp. MC1572]|uniref:Gfo/Idh/MocA family protein n=1 Tax=Luteimonas sp. MC1572 TaxID=2799325 RepID=UPI0018F0D9FF|nr:Gfo/Idh/MocA family oxidoreductase [Luteimonas sp. MC1572]MBJ6980861.1 Gfo/Idh/MocA family oxidoreductase [Luteimonas sp. MC1572]QQO02221.1 Gfo/Idh/MocA family oxidoreductase [Luteimonas sp. MC1572]
MSNPRIRVGIIGLNPGIHWAAMAHVPALAALPGDFELVGVANTSRASAERAATAFGLAHAFENAQALVASPDVDLVVVTVKVPHHHALVTAALAAGKHVYCEWPLGNGLEEARELADLAEARGVVAAVGTQMRVAPELQHVRDLVAGGYVGEVLSTTLVGSGGQWGAMTDAAHAYLYDVDNGATLLSIPLGHTLAGFRDVLGGFRHLSARLVNRRQTVDVTDAGTTIPTTTPDQVLVQGTLDSGAAFSIHYRGGMSRGTNLLWEINGTEGDILVTAASGHAQLEQLAVTGANGDATAMTALMPPPGSYEGWPDNAVARNVARMYALIAGDIRHGTRSAPHFRDAVALHETLDAIQRQQ